MIDDRDDVTDGFVCQDCLEPFNDGTGRPRSCRGCGGEDESRHDQFVRWDAQRRSQVTLVK